ncbi:[Fe-Fe] hydrogenase large subunit C-terminal domain-containing protein [Alkalitalea saponilacus]|uniref:Iron only hydrogenase large subunit, C-terminal domain n=1 Tax=Alkalitalea saponilacus TaxID=889453 RepID=A0A1T5BBE4_9BACT|nr:[Fe-Fe] hydrogenase large subunit C-terminal domain-containing protein [Alkalitalea saponilacus]ASB49729.1 ferredoxin [Alkalitalea saponilacus]SKB44330.1 Iron only hydrogenase large subunit, C-terminal domain [Alkalitalea saponilacus]
MANDQFYHALKVDESLCYGCTHCMNVCPTGAIRIRNGKASIRKNWCVDCGDCMKVCPVNAFYVEQDDFDKIYDYKYRVALVPAVMIGQFPSNISESQIFSVMRELGFTHVFQTEHTVDIINDAMIEAARKQSEKPLISSFCPAVVRLIQVKFPALVDQILLVKPPIDASAIFFRKKLQDEGIPDEEIGIFFVTPCAAKIAAVKSPVGETKSPVNGVINMDFMYNKVYHGIKNRSGSGVRSPGENLPNLGPKHIKWTLTNGEAPHMRGRCLAIDEIHNVIDILEKVENDEIPDLDFLELRACDESCAGGVLVVGNRFLTVERLRKRAELFKDIHGIPEDLASYVDFMKTRLPLKPLDPRSMLKLDEDMSVALRKMQQVRKLMCYLPGIDCGACGAPNCLSLAQDIVQKEAQLSSCVFIQRTMEKHKKLHSDHAIRIIDKVWGKDRLDKDCTKLGAKDEGT